MQQKIWDQIKREGIWLLVIIISAAVAEYLFLELFYDKDSVLSIKVQVFLGLLLFGYVIRLVARLWPTESNGSDSSPKTGVKIDRDRY